MQTDIQSRAVRRVLAAVSGLIVLLIAGTAGYSWIEGMATVDALYMTVITVSTVGFGEVRPLSPTGRLFTVALIIGGGGVAAYILSSTADFFLSGEWRSQWARRKRRKMLSQLANHIIVCGYGRVGREVAHELAAERLPFVVIDRDAETVAHVQAAGYLGLQGNAANEMHLREAGVERARGLVAAVNSDAENVFIVLTARNLRPDLAIIARANYEDTEPKLLRAGATKVIFPYRITGRRMVSMMVRPDVADFLDEVCQAGGLELMIEQVRLAPESKLVGQTITQAELRSRLGITVLACKMPDGEYNTRPGADTVLQPPMQILALGTRDQLQALMDLAGG